VAELSARRLLLRRLAAVALVFHDLVLGVVGPFRAP